MTPELKAMLLQWLETGTDVQRQHARARLAIEDGVNSDVNPPHAVAPLSSSLRAVHLGFRRCLYSSHEGCGCTGTRCYRHGRIVGLPDCISCLSEQA